MHGRIPVVALWKRTWLVPMRRQIWFLASLSGLRIQYCRELQCRLQTRLGSGVAMAVVGSCSLDSTSSLGTSICRTCGPKKKKKKKKKKKHGKGETLGKFSVKREHLKEVIIMSCICVALFYKAVLQMLLNPQKSSYRYCYFHLTNKKLRFKEIKW